MKYYLVALFDKNSYEDIYKIQRRLCDKYKIYKDIPVPHISLETIDNPDVEKLDKILLDILKPYKKFKVESSEIVCFDPPYKSVNLKIESKGYIARIARNINEKLKDNGFLVRDNKDGGNLHVSLGNTNFASRDWSYKEYTAACTTAKKEDFYKLAKIEKIELWKQINNRKEVVVKSYALRDFM